MLDHDIVMDSCRKSIIALASDAVLLFNLLDVRGAGRVRKQEFVEVCSYLA